MNAEEWVAALKTRAECEDINAKVRAGQMSDRVAVFCVGMIAAKNKPKPRQEG